MAFALPPGALKQGVNRSVTLRRAGDCASAAPVAVAGAALREYLVIDAAGSGRLHVEFTVPPAPDVQVCFRPDATSAPLSLGTLVGNATATATVTLTATATDVPEDPAGALWPVAWAVLLAACCCCCWWCWCCGGWCCYSPALCGRWGRACCGWLGVADRPRRSYSESDPPPDPDATLTFSSDEDEAQVWPARLLGERGPRGCA